MPLFRQLELEFAPRPNGFRFAAEPFHLGNGDAAVVEQALRLPMVAANGTPGLQLSSRRDSELESLAAHLMRLNGAGRIAKQIRVEWNRRLKSCAGRADYKTKLISLNPLLCEHGPGEINQTFLHELAHLLAQFRAGGKRILPHGNEWRRACADLGIPGEKRCHSLPLPVAKHTRRYLYRCPNCRRDFPRVRPIRRVVACLACCRAHNGGEFDKRFRLRRVGSGQPVPVNVRPAHSRLD